MFTIAHTQWGLKFYIPCTVAYIQNHVSVSIKTSQVCIHTYMAQAEYHLLPMKAHTIGGFGEGQCPSTSPFVPPTIKIFQRNFLLIFIVLCFVTYRIAGKFGKFHCYERLARKNLANG